jgi:PAS domain S-box-containing protein
LIDDEVAAQREAEQARKQQAQSDQRYRRSMETAAIGIGLLTPDGKFVEVNPALCRLLGYDAETLTQKTWQELTPPEYQTVGQEERNALFSGRLDAYRVVKQYIHADGHRLWAEVSVSSVRDENGQVETLAFQIADITATVEANERNAILTQRLEQKSQRLAAELASAASYMASIMPQGLTGRVDITSRYLPSRELGGDCFEYTWIDDDHLLVYLIDVSGHGH